MIDQRARPSGGRQSQHVDVVLERDGNAVKGTLVFARADISIRLCRLGECEIFGPKVSGVGVVVGSRVAALAGPSEVLVTRTVRDLVAGSGLHFADRGERHLKGITEPWRLFAASA